MARPPKPWWHEDRACYYTQAGGKQFKLLNPDGSPVARGDEAGKAALAAFLGERRQAKAPKGLTVKAVFQAWLDWSRTRRKIRTVGGHRAIVNAFIGHRARGRVLGNLPANALALDHWGSYQQAMEGRGAAPRTIEAHFATVKACWRWAAREVVGRTPTRLIRSDPFRDASLELAAERRRVRGTVAPGDVAKILAALDAREDVHEGIKVAARIQAETGCRTSQVLELEWRHWRGRWFEIPPEDHKTGGKTGKALVVAVTAGTAERIEAWRAKGHPRYVAKRLWGPMRDRRPSSKEYINRFAEAAAAVGLPDVRPYWMRDAFSIEARQAGVAPTVTARIQGHSPEVAARHYQTLGGEEAAAVVERVASRRAEGKDDQ